VEAGGGGDVSYYFSITYMNHGGIETGFGRN